MIVWPKRLRKETWKHTGLHLVLISKCKKYRVSQNVEYAGMPILACVVDAIYGWQLISRHKKITAAMKACEGHAKQS